MSMASQKWRSAVYLFASRRTSPNNIPIQYFGRVRTGWRGRFVSIGYKFEACMGNDMECLRRYLFHYCFFQSIDVVYTYVSY